MMREETTMRSFVTYEEVIKWFLPTVILLFLSSVSANLWLLSKHEKVTHRESVTYREFLTMKSDITAIKDELRRLRDARDAHVE